MKLFKKLFSSPIAAVLTLLVLLFFPAALARPAQGDLTAIVTAMGIDKEAEQYKLSLQVLTPQTDPKSVDSLETIESTGKNVADALNNASLKMGKNIGLEHVAVIVVGKTLQNENLLQVLDYFYKTGKITLKTVLVYTNGDSMAVIENSNELNDLAVNSLQNNIAHNKMFLDAGRATTLQSFYNESKSKAGVTTLAQIDKNEEAEKNKPINNMGKSAVFKEGKWVTEVDGKLYRGLSWLQKETRRGLITLENNAAVAIKNIKVKTRPQVKDDKLVLKARIVVTCETVEGRQSDVKQLLKNQIQQDIENSLTFCKENNLDLFAFYDKFYKYKTTAFKKYLRNIDPDIYLQQAYIIPDIYIKQTKA